MDAPGAPDDSAVLPIYGDGKASINRRTIIGGAITFAAAPALAQMPLGPGDAEAELARIKEARWTGTLGLSGPQEHRTETSITPFVRARSDVWRSTETRDYAHVTIIDGNAAYFRIDDLQDSLPVLQARNQREEFGLYSYLLQMLIVQRRTVERDPKTKLFLFRYAHPGLPPIEFDWDVTARRIGRARYDIHRPFGEGMIRQDIEFSGRVGSDALGWPREISIARDGKPISNLTIDSFSIDYA